MKGFWETWAHIVVGLAGIAAVSYVAFVLYDTGWTHGRAGAFKAGYEYGYEVGKDRGYCAGYKDGSNRETYGRSK